MKAIMIINNGNNQYRDLSILNHVLALKCHVGNIVRSNQWPAGGMAWRKPVAWLCPKWRSSDKRHHA